jgi:type II secretory pathway pseudopilin PulG
MRLCSGLNDISLVFGGVLRICAQGPFWYNGDMKHETRSTKFETNSKDRKNKFQTGRGVLGFSILNFDIVSDFACLPVGMGFRISDFHRKSEGFTMVEIVIMLGIIVMVSTVVLVNFPAVTETIFIQRSGQEISGLLRRAQSMSLAVRSARNPQDGSVRSPCGVGVHFTNNSGIATLFGDMPDLLSGDTTCGSSDRFFNPSIDATIATFTLERNLKIALSTPTRPPGAVPGELNVVFMSPDASVSILGDSIGDDIGQTDARASIKIVTPKLDLQRIVEISITGQISVK